MAASSRGGGRPRGSRMQDQSSGTAAAAHAETAPPLDNVKDFPDGPPDASGLTPRQRKVLDVIRASVDRRGYPPSMREIGEPSADITSSVVTLTAWRQGSPRRDPSAPRRDVAHLKSASTGTIGDRKGDSPTHLRSAGLADRCLVPLAEEATRGLPAPMDGG